MKRFLLKTCWTASTAVLVILAAIACTKATKKQDDCRTQTTEFRRWLQALYSEGDGHTPSGDQNVKLPGSTQTTRPGMGPTLRVDGTVVSASSVAIADTREIMSDNDASWQPGFRAALTKRLQRWRPKVTVVMLQLDTRTQWKVVRKLVDEIRKVGVTAVMFLFRKPTNVRPPPPSKIDATLEQLERKLEAGGRRIADPPVKALDVYGACTYTRKAAAMAADQLGHQRPRTIGDAVIKCSCKIDLAAAKAKHWWMSGRLTKHREVTVGRRLGITTKQGHVLTQIAALDSAPWSKTYKLIVSAKRSGSYVLVPKTNTLP